MCFLEIFFKKTSLLFLIATTAIFHSFSLPLRAMEGAEEKSVAASAIPVKVGPQRLRDGLYTMKVEEDLYLSMERVSSESDCQWWKEYQLLQEQHIDSLKCSLSDEHKGSLEYAQRLPFQKAIKEANDPLHNFGNSLAVSDRRKQVWVCYATHTPVSQNGVIDKQSIEMAMAVITDSEAPFTTHMGIARSMYQIHEGLPTHRGLAMKLHSLAAEVMLTEDPRKAYMITTPLKAMMDIFKCSLPPEAIGVGDSLTRQETEGLITHPENSN